jgi:SH3 domain-containing YSC84-like protein 1
MKRLICSLAACALAAGTVAFAANKHADRINDAAKVLREIHAVPDKDIPQELWERAACAIVIPDLKKAAFIVGGEYGKGLMSCRRNGAWGAPVFMELEKGSFGFQIGAQEIDLVLLVMNRDGMEKLLNNKVQLGAEASVAAGPVGRDARAGTDAQMKAEILSYSRAQGLFAGIDLSGGALKPDVSDTEDLYGKGATPKSIVMDGKARVPADLRVFMSALARDTVGTAGKK